MFSVEGWMVEHTTADSHWVIFNKIKNRKWSIQNLMKEFKPVALEIYESENGKNNKMNSLFSNFILLGFQSKERIRHFSISESRWNWITKTVYTITTFAIFCLSGNGFQSSAKKSWFYKSNSLSHENSWFLKNFAKGKKSIDWRLDGRIETDSGDKIECEICQ